MSAIRSAVLSMQDIRQAIKDQHPIAVFEKLEKNVAYYSISIAAGKSYRVGVRAIIDLEDFQEGILYKEMEATNLIDWVDPTIKNFKSYI